MIKIGFSFAAGILFGGALVQAAKGNLSEAFTALTGVCCLLLLAGNRP